MVPNAQLGTDSIEMTNTDVDAELFLQCRLHFTARHLRSRAAGRKQPLEHSFSQFGWMPLSPILKSCFSPRLYRLQQAIRG